MSNNRNSVSFRLMLLVSALVLIMAKQQSAKAQEQGVQKLHRMERPRIWFENGVPKVLFLAAFEEGNDHNYNIHIPLRND